jgi:alpha-methylacyl-CoA racemase
MTPVLAGIRIVEFEALGPGPLAGLMLAGLGAEVTVVSRPGAGGVAQALGGAGPSPLLRGKQVVPLNLKLPDDRARALDLVAQADGLIEGNRPGVMERLGLGPADCAARNPRLVYGRMTGWGQSGPLAPVAGHDLNYVALTGLLSLSANRGERPIVPPTVVGDAAGAQGLVLGMVSAMLAVRLGSPGRVVDAAIVDIVAQLGTLVQWVRAAGQIDGPVPSPFHDSPFYAVYTCADGAHITLCALEPQFYALLLQRLGLDDVEPGAQYDRAAWPQLSARLQALFASQPRPHWCALLEGTDACFAPVLSVADAVTHPHNQARGTFRLRPDGAIEVAPAPRFLPLGVPAPAA